MGTIDLLQIEKKGFIVRYKYNVSKDLQKYFSLNDTLFIRYGENVESVPDSLLVVPFVANVLPIVWLTDAILSVNEIDSKFYSSIERIKSGYVQMYPDFSFNGNIEAKSVIENIVSNGMSKTGVMFSGGLDAYSTLIAHRSENPHLLTVGGADVGVNDLDGWNLIKQQTYYATKEFDLPEPFFIESNFRHFIIETELDILVSKSNDGWWHGFQHGIGLLGLTAPIAYLHNIKLIYIASSFWNGTKITCASDPTIDNQLEFCETNIIHDQYDCSRQQKIILLSDFLKDNKKQLFLRVCWKSHDGDNCCKCEKCYRTIFGLLAEGLNPEDFGFTNYKQYLSGAEKIVSGFMKESPVLRIFWRDIQDRYNELQIYKDDKNFNWIYNLRFDQNYSKFYLAVRSFHRSARSLIGKILRTCHLR